jgi:hypothetical protein
MFAFLLFRKVVSAARLGRQPAFESQPCRTTSGLLGLDAGGGIGASGRSPAWCDRIDG